MYHENYFSNGQIVLQKYLQQPPDAAAFFHRGPNS